MKHTLLATAFLLAGCGAVADETETRTICDQDAKAYVLRPHTSTDTFIAKRTPSLDAGCKPLPKAAPEPLN